MIKTTTALIIAGILFSAAFSLAQDKEQEKRIATLIMQLQDDDLETREKAAQELFQIGKPALPALRKALESSNVEVQGRAQQVVNRYVQTESSKLLKSGDQPLYFKPLTCHESLQKYFPGTVFYAVSLTDEKQPPFTMVYLKADNEVRQYALGEDHKDKETTLLKEIKQAKITVKDRQEAQEFGLAWLVLAHGCDTFTVETTDHQFETRY